MKNKYLLNLILFLFIIQSKAQSITITDSCAEFINGKYIPYIEINGKLSFIKETGTAFLIVWTGTRWEHGTNTGGLGMYNNADTPSPPSSNFSAWTPVECNPAGDFSGDGTTDTTLSSDYIDHTKIEIQIVNSKISISQSRNYKLKVFNSLGQQIQNKNLKKGLYIVRITTKTGKVVTKKIFIE